MQQQGVKCNFADSIPWVILSPIEQSIRRKIESIGTPLKDWDINIYRGVLTGYNDAFIISTEKRNEILANCQTEGERQKTAELIEDVNKTVSAKSKILTLLTRFFCMKEEFDFESIKNKAIEQLRAGKPLLGKDGAFAPLLESILNAALEGEMDAHLTEEERQMGNRRNGKMQKQVQTPLGEVTVSTPRDRNSSFDPQFIKKRETILAEGVADRIIGLYALGNSTREISDWMEENLGNRISADTISAITDRVLPEIKAWKSRMLDSVYPIVWMDAIHYKVTDERGCAVIRAIYNVLGIDREGHKELLGMYISRNEGANFWLSVPTDLQNRGVEDILIACIDGLKGFPEAIQSVYPNTAVQLCVVHQIRNSIKYVGSKNQKEFLKDLKCVYQAVNKESAENELLKLEEKWGEQYPVVIRSWQENWDKLSEYFQYTPAIRKLIYTTNTVEGYHRQIRKVTKNKGVFPSDTALEKLVYLAYRNIRKKWTMPLANWATISLQLAIKFGEQFKLL